MWKIFKPTQTSFYEVPNLPIQLINKPAVKTFLVNGNRVCVIPQNLIEFWNVVTRPVDKNGFGWLPAKTDVEISRPESLLTVLPDSQTIYRDRRKVVLDNSVLGKQVHDARIVAAMNVYQITKLLTFNLKDASV